MSYNYNSSSSIGTDSLLIVGISMIVFLVLYAIFTILAIGLSQFKGFTRADIKTRGWNALRSGKYWVALGVSFVGSLLGGAGAGYSTGSFSFNFEDADSGISYSTGIMSPAIAVVIAFVVIFAFLLSTALVIFVSNIITVGMNRFFLKNLVGRPSFGELFFGFKNGKYLKVCSTMFFMVLYTFLWSLLFVIPGIIKSYEYFMVPYILAENPDIDRREAFRLSKEMMHGHKWNTFVLSLSFIGWELLGAMCCGIGTIFVVPYINSAFAALYEKLRNNIPESDIESYLSNDIFKKYEPEQEVDSTIVTEETVVEEAENKEAVSEPKTEVVLNDEPVTTPDSDEVLSGDVE